MKENDYKRCRLMDFLTLLAIVILIFSLSACASDEPSIDTSIPPEEEMMLSLSSADFDKAVLVYNERIHTTNLEARFSEELTACITDTVASWANMELEYEPAAAILEKLTKIKNPEIAFLATDQFNLIMVEGKGSELFLSAQAAFETDNYIDAMVMISEINSEYSQYDAAADLYGCCKEMILAIVENPTTIEEYEENIAQLKDHITKVAEPAFTTRLNQLENEFVIFKDVEKIAKEATSLYDKGDIGEAFLALEAGLSKYPGNSHMQEKFQTVFDLFIINTTTQVKAACEAKEYKEALNVVNTAISEYDCPELQELLIFVREERNVLFKIKNDIVDVVNSLKDSWKKEDLSVKEVGSQAGAYVVKSGKKILLGDYTDEEVTVLSCSGNVVASIANLDLLFDIRDLTYDIQNWGEGEYFVAHLAVDTVALIPVIGMVKYFKHIDSAGDLPKAIANLADAAKISDSVSDASKNADTIGEAVDTAKGLSKTSDATGKTLRTKLIKHYTYIRTPNMHLKGKVFPGTNVKMVEKKLEYSDGRLLRGVFPQFNSAKDIQLPKELYKSSSTAHKTYLNKQLKDLINKGDSKLMKQFTPEEIEIISKGELPPSYVWHHNEKEGLMQLVSKEEHDLVKHTGGMSLWGMGYGNKVSTSAAA